MVWKFLQQPLCELDKDTYNIIEFERKRQQRKLILIASESICSRAALEAQNSVFSNLYAEGYPSLRLSYREKNQVLDYARYLSFHRRYGDRRHYKGCDYVNFIEVLAQWRAAQLFANSDEHVNISPQDIFVNVQALSGAAANNAVYHALLQPGDTIMGLALPHGGHLTHGSEFNRSGKIYHGISYEINPKTGRIDYAALHESAKKEHPKLIIAGASAYPWDIEWKTLRDIADDIGALLLADISHPSGLVAAKLISSPVGYADVVTMTTHKTLCGPRGSLILSTHPEIAKKVENAVFPGEQGGPHVNTIAGLAVAFKLAQTEAYRDLMKQVVKNCQTLAKSLQNHGLHVVHGGSQTHLCLIDLKELPQSKKSLVSGDIASNILDLCGITCNKNTIPGDLNAAYSSAIRLGATWVTQLGMKESEMEKIAEVIALTLNNIESYQIQSGGGTRARGKLPFSIMMQVQKQVAELMQGIEYSNTLGYPHYKYQEGSNSENSDTLEKFRQKITKQDLPAISYNENVGIIEISGERADIFVSEITTVDSFGMKPGKGARTFILDEKGNIIEDVQLFRLPEKQANFSRYLIITSPERRDSLKTWLRALSDGYIQFDNTCIYSKITGPVVVSDWHDAFYATIVLPETTKKTLDEVLPDTANAALENFDILEQPNFWLAKTQYGDQSFYELYCSIEQALGLVDKLSPAVSWQNWEEISAKRNRVYEISQATQISKSFCDSKPYFIGESTLKPTSPAKQQYEFADYDGPLRRTTLYEEHKKLTKKIVPFAGWEMPVLYTSILDEHNIVRNTAGLFDVSHMGVLEISGHGAARFLDLVTTNYATKLRTGQSHYSYLLAPNGSVLDDIMVYRRSWDNFMVVVNAANAEKNFAWLNAVNSRKYIIDESCPSREIDVSPTIKDLRDEQYGRERRVDLALQGPNSCFILQALTDDKQLKNQIALLGKSFFLEVELCGFPVIISRSGYTGENWGYELYVHPDDAPGVWNAILEKGKPFGVHPVGLGARDSTRTEAGFPLYGHELAGDFDVTPMEAGYGAFVKYHKPFFIGKQSLLKKDQESQHTIVRFQMEAQGIRAIRPGAVAVDRKKGKFIGIVTSCTFIDKDQIGMAYIEKRYATENNTIGVFVVPPNKKLPPAKSILELKSGDNVTLHENATIVSRFPLRTCTNHGK